MEATTTAPLPDDATLTELRRLCDAALFTDAWQLARELRPPEHWSGVAPRVLAGRLLSNWGSPALADRVHWLTWRRHPASAEALFFGVFSTRRRHGAYEALRLLTDAAETRALRAEAPPLVRARLGSLEALLLAEFRDFDRAHALADEARDLAPDDPWIAIDRAGILERQDRYAEALASAERALALRPWYRPGIESAAHLLQLLGRDDDAIALLTAAGAHTQAASIRGALVRLLTELGDHRGADAALVGIETMLPRMERRYRDWLAAVRADVAYKLGDFARAREAAAGSEYFFQQHMRERLAAPPTEHRRVQLPVGFVRQHHMTCAPATLAAIGRHWNLAIDHAALAARITYDGTPHHEERHWAETNGWHAREFRLTWEAAVALLDRGMPFTLTTVYTRSAHLQAVIGYDATLRTVIIRDPYERTHGEFIADRFLTAAASHGPRAMVLVPEAQLALLDGIELPDAPLYDAYHRFRRALVVHDRAAAGAALAALERDVPDHLLTLSAARSLAGYDATPAHALTIAERLLARFPEDANLLLDQTDLLHRLGRLPERRAALHAATQKRGSDPLLQREWIEILRDEPENLARATARARSVLSRRPTDAAALRTLGNVLWSRRELIGATFVYRLAASAAVTAEEHWRACFVACRHTGQVEECLALLRVRLAQLGARSSAPAQTLFYALETLDRTDEAWRVLDEALAQRPDDGELKCYAARQRARQGDAASAAALLAAAQPLTRRLSWLRDAAFVASCALDYPRALECWSEVLAADAFDEEAAGESTRLIAMLRGRAAALGHLRAQVARQPHFVPLRVRLAEWLREEDATERMRVIDEIIALDPRNAWAWREKALAARDAGRPEEALPAAERALREEPGHVSSHSVQGDMLLALQRFADARRSFEAALRLDISADWVVGRLLNACHSTEERRAALAFVQAEILRQAGWGDTILAWRVETRGILPPEEVAAWLGQLHADRPHQWQAWVALVAHHAENGRAPEALALAQQTVARFPTLPRVWLDLAACHARLEQTDDEIAALQKALTLNPAWSLASRRLGIAHERRLDLAAAAHTYERGIAADPLDAALRGHLADAWWKLGRRDEAITQLSHAVQLDPGYSWAWRHLHHWHVLLGRPDATLDAARRTAEARAGEARGWLQYAYLLQDADRLDEALAAVERALGVEPRNVEAHDQRASVLTWLARFDDALAACTSAVFGDATPHTLLGRAAWIESRRGDLDRAIERMRAVVTHHADYIWGWERLAEWYDQKDKHQDALAAAEQLVRLTPTSATAWGYLALQQIALERPAVAKQSLREALKHEPDYIWGANRLLELVLKDEDFAEAAEILAMLQAHASPATHARARVQVLRAQLKRAEAVEALAPLLAAPEPETPQLRQAAEALFHAGWHDDMEPVLLAALAAAGTNDLVASLWVRSWSERRSWTHIFRLARARATSALAASAWAEFFEALGEKRRSIITRLLVVTQRRRLRATTATWGSAGYALLSCHLNRTAAFWLRDWRAHPDAKPWMLFNSGLAFLLTGRFAAAAAVLDRALELPPDHMRGPSVALRAWLAAIAGDHATAATLLARAPVDAGMGNIARQCLAGARAIVALAAAPPAQRRTLLAAHHDPLHAVIRETNRGRDIVALTRILQRTWRRLAQLTTAPGAWLLGRLPGLTWWHRAQHSSDFPTGRVIVTLFAAAIALRILLARWFE